MIPTPIKLLTHKIPLMKNIITFYLNIVILTTMEPLMLVKYTLVLLNVKMLGEMLTVKVMDTLIATVHSTFQNVMVLGTVPMLS